MSSGPHNEGIKVTNDGATILKNIGVDNPAAKVLVGEPLVNFLANLIKELATKISVPLK